VRNQLKSATTSESEADRRRLRWPQVPLQTWVVRVLLVGATALTVAWGASWASELGTETFGRREGGAVELVYFYLEGCPACREAEVFLAELAEDHPQLRVVSYSLANAEGRKLLGTLKELYGLSDVSPAAPTMFVGDVAIVGRDFYRDQEEPVRFLGPSWGFAIEEAVQHATDEEHYFVLRYCEQELGYCIGFPVDWTFANPRNYSIVFSGGDGTEASAVSVWIQLFTAPSLGPGEHSTRTLIDRYKFGLIDHSTYLWIDSRAYPEGDGYIAEYVLPTGRYRQWRVAMAHDGAFYSWAYTAPADLYLEYVSVAEAMLATWRLLGVR